MCGYYFLLPPINSKFLNLYIIEMRWLKVSNDLITIGNYPLFQHHSRTDFSWGIIIPLAIKSDNPKFKSGVPMVRCPNCHSDRVDKINLAKKSCGFLGMLGGAATSTPLNNVELPVTLDTIPVPVTPVTSLAQAILNTLFRSAVGGIAGAKLGEVIDERILDNHQCLSCNYVFSSSSTDDISHY
jgi:hypothetical protein